MTREEALNKIHKHVGNGLTDAFRIVNKIFDEHEAQLKAKDEEIERLKRDLTAWSMLFDEPQDNKL